MASSKSLEWAPFRDKQLGTHSYRNSPALVSQYQATNQDVIFSISLTATQRIGFLTLLRENYMFIVFQRRLYVAE